MKFPLLCLFVPAFACAQQRMDKKVIIDLADTTDIYNKVKHALVKKDYIVKDDGNKTLLTTYPREFKTMRGYSVLNAEIRGNTVILSGSYGLIKIDGFGYTVSPKAYKPIVYYKGSTGWEVLMLVAELIGTQITYSK